jgi:hypothetical protein
MPDHNASGEQSSPYLPVKSASQLGNTEAQDRQGETGRYFYYLIMSLTLREGN